ncbi:MAG: V-type ATPase subunit [Ruminococcaceae bacterium]|nr:V-type ATPase subunit [Oscillospiraceae bacterium]
MPNHSFYYANGRITGLERSLLKKNELDSISELPRDRAIKSLVDCGYGQGAADKSNLGALISAEMEKLQQEIYDLTPNRKMTDLFFIDLDAINFKLYFKSELLGNTLTPDELVAGVFDRETLILSLENKDYEAFGEAFSPYVEKMAKEIELLEETANPMAVSQVVDRFVFSYIFDTIKKLRDSYLKNYFSNKVDFLNILSVLRSKTLRWDKARAEEMMIDGGFISSSDIMDNYEFDIVDLVGKIPLGPNEERIKRAILQYDSSEVSIEFLQNAFAEILNDTALNDEYDVFGIGPIASYIIRKINEARELRTIFSKKNS